MPVLLKRELTILVTVKYWALVHNRNSLMKLLLEWGAWVSIDKVDNNGMTALHSAAIRGYEMSVKLLLENGANTKIESHLGWTPLLLAEITGSYKVTTIGEGSKH